MMQRNKKRIVGITGGSGCGKSYISDKLRKRGIPVIDADLVAREVMQKGEECLEETVRFFGTEILDKNGELDRHRLGQIVFSDQEKLKKLNEISHKYILRRIFNKMRAEKSDIVCVDGAVLIESGIKCDLMLGICADREIRIDRIMCRDGILRFDAEKRIDAQPKTEFYEKNCDFVIYNNDKNIDIDGIYKRIAE